MIFDHCKILLAIACLGMVTASSIQASTPVFLPDRGSVYPDTWDTGVFSGMFQNPTQLRLAKRDLSIRIDGSQDGLDYQQLSGGVVGKIDDVAVSIGYYRFGNDTLTRTQRNSSTTRVEEAGLFSDTIQQGSVCIAFSPVDGIDIGLNADLVQKSIATASATQVAAGFGIRYQWAPDAWMNTYWRRPIQTSLVWSSRVSESTVGSPFIGLEYRPNWCDITVSISPQTVLSSVAIPLATEFSICGSIAAGDVNRYSIGTELRLGVGAIQYIHTAFSEQLVNESQEMIGVVLNFDYAVK